MTTRSSTNREQAAPQSYHEPQRPDANEAQVAALISKIRIGLYEDDASNFVKLQIARKYGPFVKELKALAPHGDFKKLLREHFPRASYDKCNRWRYLAENEDRIAAALEEFPDVKWGPKKMTDFLKGYWSPKAEDEDERYDGDEDEYLGISAETALPGSEVEINSEAPEGEEAGGNFSDEFHADQGSGEVVQLVEDHPVTFVDCVPEAPRLVDELPSVAMSLDRIAQRMATVDWSSEDHKKWLAEIQKVKQAIKAVSQKVQIKNLPRGRPPKTPK